MHGGFFPRITKTVPMLLVVLLPLHLIWNLRGTFNVLDWNCNISALPRHKIYVQPQIHYHACIPAKTRSDAHALSVDHSHKNSLAFVESLHLGQRRWGSVF